MPQIEVTLLGTGNPLPSPKRAGPATLVRAGAAVLLFDCGRAVVMRMAAAGVMPAGLGAVLLTHLHSDHITDLNDVVTMRWVMAPSPMPLVIYGPPGTAAVVDAMRAMLDPDVGYRIAHHADMDLPPQVSVTEVTPGQRLEMAGVTVSVEETDHRPVTPTVGYRVEWEGMAAAIAGDTRPCPGLDALCRDADLYVQTVVREDLVRAVPIPRFQDILDYHSTVEDAARTAARGRVRTLVMTHYVPELADGDEGQWREQAAAFFGGEIVLGPDLTSAVARRD
ncbi:MAG: MBL fold metallo-hydrolase [Acidimicrobiales bacterium]